MILTSMFILQRDTNLQRLWRRRRWPACG